jgi:hypothetical protein
MKLFWTETVFEGTHTVFIGDVLSSETLKADAPSFYLSDFSGRTLGSSRPKVTVFMDSGLKIAGMTQW